MIKEQIRVLIVEDSPVMGKLLTDILNSDPALLVVGLAGTGKEAVDLAPKLKPDIITMDINLPEMDGFEATKQIMAYFPTPILIVSSSVFKGGMERAFKALAFGALDVFDKQLLEVGGGIKTEYNVCNFLAQVKFLSGIRVITHPLAKLEKPKAIAPIKEHKKAVAQRIVAMVSSTGGPEALLYILKKFPKDFPCGIVIVQHISLGFTEGLAEWLNSECSIAVKVAGDKEPIQPGTAYIAPNDFQMRVTAGGRIKLTDEPPYDGHKPSGNVLLASVADVYKEGAIGVILTGMGADGAFGIKTIKGNDGVTMAEDEKSSVVFGMPKVAIEMGVVDKVLPLDMIAEEIVKEL